MKKIVKIFFFFFHKKISLNGLLTNTLRTSVSISQYIISVWQDYFCQLILLFSIILLLFMSLTVLFDTIYRSHYTISANFYLYLHNFQQKVFNFSKISEFQIKKE